MMRTIADKIKPAVSKEILLLVVIFAISFLIRYIGVKQGFPLLTRHDEKDIIDPVFHMSQNLTLNPGNFKRPNQILYIMNFIYLNVMSYLRYGEGFAARLMQHEFQFYYYARLLIAFMGSLIPIVAYQIGKLFKPKFALAAGLVFMSFPSYVRHSIVITPDVPITLFTLIVIYFTLRYVLRNDDKAIFIASVFAAVNTAEKYPGILSLLIVFTGIIIKASDEYPLFSKALFKIAAIKIIKAGLLFILTLILVAPNLFLNFPQVKDAIISEAQPIHLGHDNLGLTGRLLFYIQSFMSWTNILAIIFILIGIVFIFKCRNKASLLLFYGAFYWIALSFLALYWERWALPMYITPLFLSAIGIQYSWDNFRNKPIPKFALPILIGIFLFLQFVNAIHISAQMALTDTRVVSLEFCRQEGISPYNSVYDGYTPLQPQRAKVIIHEYENKGPEIEYVILSSSIYNRYYREPVRYSRQIAVYDQIRSENQLIKIVVPHPLASNFSERIDDIVFYVKWVTNNTQEVRLRGPVIEIYQVTN